MQLAKIFKVGEGDDNHHLSLSLYVCKRLTSIDEMQTMAMKDYELRATSYEL